MEDVQFRQFGFEVLIKATEDASGDWIISGPVASSKRDHDGELLSVEGIRNGLKTFFKLGGVVDVGHKFGQTHNYDWIIGKGIGIQEVEGKPWLVIKLLKTKEKAQEIWRHITSCKEAGVNPGGLSIEGLAAERNPKDKTHITDTAITSITFDARPKGYDQTIQIGAPQPLTALVKSMALSDDFVTMMMKGMNTDYSSGDMDTESEIAKADTPEEKASRASVKYKDSESATRNCGHCAFYRGGSCTKVAGAIHPDDICKLFQAVTRKAIGDLDKAVSEARKTCPTCGSAMYCVSCHNKAGAKVVKATPSDPMVAKISAVAGKFKHSGDYGDCYWHPGTKSVHWTAGDADGEDDMTPLDEIDHKLRSIPGVKGVTIGDEHGPSGDGWQQLTLQKALETGAGIVQAGDVGGRALRTQNLQGGSPVSATCCDCGDKLKPGRKKRCAECYAKYKNKASKAVSPLVSTLRSMGAHNPGAIAELIRKR